MITCPNCAIENVEGSVICEVCGQSLLEQELSESDVFQLTPKGMLVAAMMNKVGIPFDDLNDFAEQILEHMRIYAGKLDCNAIIWNEGRWHFVKVENLTET